jgi:hypothetical protein
VAHRLFLNNDRSWGGAIARLLTLLAMLPLAGASAGEAFALIERDARELLTQS